MRDLPSVVAQRRALVRWFIKFADWRPSEAAVGISGWGARKRRDMFRRLRTLNCIALNSSGEWEAVADLPDKRAQA